LLGPRDSGGETERRGGPIEWNRSGPNNPDRSCAAGLARGELARGEAAAIAGLGDRMGRTILSQRVGLGLLTRDTPKGPVRIAFAPDHIDQLFPRLFYEA
jgi:hypothetical protein